MRYGLLVLNDYPPEKREEIASFLSRYTKNGITVSEIKKLLLYKPLILKRGISEQEAQIFIEKLSSYGADVSFVLLEETDNKKAAKITQKENNKCDNSIEQTQAKSDILQILNDKDYEKTYVKDSATKSPFKEKLCKKLKERIKEEIYRVNKEIWLVFSLVLIVALMNYLVDSQRLLLSLYTLPTIFSAYYFGKRHAVLTALASIVLVISMLYYLPQLFHDEPILRFKNDNWQDFVVWGSTLIITAYAMGTLYDRYREKIKELQKTYQGILVILRHFISKDEYTENHCYRVSVYAVKIAQYLGLPEERIEDLRAAALLHDLGKLKISREILYKAARLSQEEFNEIKKHVTSGTELLEPLSGAFGRIIPIILAHHERCDGSGYLNLSCEEIPLEAKILAVADVYDALVSDRPYRKGLPPFEAKEIILKEAGKHFDPVVVRAFVKAFENGELEVPKIIV